LDELRPTQRRKREAILYDDLEKVCKKNKCNFAYISKKTSSKSDPVDLLGTTTIERARMRQVPGINICSEYEFVKLKLKMAKKFGTQYRAFLNGD
jgi:hypothetical protein